jgi:hypothetical protein
MAGNLLGLKRQQHGGQLRTGGLTVALVQKGAGLLGKAVAVVFLALASQLFAGLGQIFLQHQPNVLFGRWHAG